MTNKLYSGDKWTLSHVLSTPDPTLQLRAHINSVAFQYTTEPVTSIDGSYSFVVPSAVSATFPPGTYSIAITSTSGTERSTLSAGEFVKVLPDPTEIFTLSIARRMVSAIESLLEGRLTNSHALYSSLTFEGRSLTQMSPLELQKALQIYKNDVAAEEQADAIAKGQGGRKNKLRVYFK
jgi:hypothetical protein